MSPVRSDNRLEAHYKPVQEFERNLVSGVYVDWGSETEVNDFFTTNSIPTYFKRNKYFWIAGTLYQVDDDEITFRPIGPGFIADIPDQEFLVALGIGGVAADGSTFQHDDMIGRKVRVFRGSMKQSIINVAGYYYSFDSVTGTITWFPNLYDGELIQIEITNVQVSYLT